MPSHPLHCCAWGMLPASLVKLGLSGFQHLLRALLSVKRQLCRLSAGGEKFTLHVRDLATHKELLKEPIKETAGQPADHCTLSLCSTAGTPLPGCMKLPCTQLQA